MGNSVSLFSFKKMSLKVVRYKNYGCMIESGESKDPYDNRFFWCFFELSNGKIIDLQLVENLKNKKIRDIDYDFSYAKEELKTGLRIYLSTIWFCLCKRTRTFKGSWISSLRDYSCSNFKWC